MTRDSDYDRWEEEADDAAHGMAQNARDLALDLEAYRCDVDPHEICTEHGTYIPLSTGDCAACLDAMDARRRFDKFTPYRGDHAA